MDCLKALIRKLRMNKRIANIIDAIKDRCFATKYTREMKEFIDLNNLLWKGKKVLDNNNGTVLVTMTTDAPDAFWRVMKRAEAYREKEDAQIHVVLRGHFRNNGNIYKVIDSFNPDKYTYYEGYDRLRSIKREKKEAIRIADEFFSKNKDIECFINWKINGVKIGDLIYDTIIRNHDICTIDDLNVIKDKYYEDVVDGIRLFVFYKNMFDSNQIRMFITNEYTYYNGIPIRMAVSYKARVICSTGYGTTEYDERNVLTSPLSLINTIKPEELGKRCISDNYFETVCDAYFEQRITGKSIAFDGKNAYGSKKRVSELELKKQLGIREDEQKRIVLLAAHVFSDACHGFEQWVFRDYYDWLEYTIKRLEGKDDITVLFKPHPSAKAYGESEVAETNRLANEYQYLKIIPNDISTTSALLVADVVLTAAGTIGLEAACMGIEAVNVCRSYYSGFGVVKEITSIEEYGMYLDNLDKKQFDVDSEKKKVAKAILYLTMNNSDDSPICLRKIPITPGDDFGSVVNKQYEYLNERMKDSTNVFDNEYERFLKDF